MNSLLTDDYVQGDVEKKRKIDKLTVEFKLGKSKLIIGEQKRVLMKVTIVQVANYSCF